MEVRVRFLETRTLHGNMKYVEGETYVLPERRAAAWVKAKAAEYADAVAEPVAEAVEADIPASGLIFDGKTVFILGGGNSLRGFDFERLRGLTTIALNSTAKLWPEASMLFFMDGGWFRKNREFIGEWQGMVASIAPVAKRAFPTKVLRVEIEHREAFPQPGISPIRWGRSSGHIAVSLAIAMGARRIVLLGYDMSAIDGLTHCHDDYQNPDHEVYAREFIPAFTGWNADALAVGVDIVNATPGSALTEFPPVEIDDEIAMARASA